MSEENAAAPSSDRWFYEQDDGRHGPHTLLEMRELVQGGVIRRSTRVWPPNGEPGSAADIVALLSAPPTNAGLDYLVPVNRSGWAIAAGYLGLFSFIPGFCYAGAVVSLYAAIHLKRHPESRGWGRVITGLVISIPASIIYTYVFLGGH
jgi:hypothetical protein